MTILTANSAGRAPLRRSGPKPRGKSCDGSARPFDIRAGLLLRQKRQARDISLEGLSALMGHEIAWQQVQKHELAINRISIERLCQYASALGFDPGAFLREVRAT